MRSDQDARGVGASSQIIKVGTNVQASLANKERDHLEVSLASDPENPDFLVGCSMIKAAQPSSQFYDTIVYTSLDAGKTWRASLEDTRAADSDKALLASVDPSCAVGPDGAAYFVTLDERESIAGGNVLRVFRSSDRGKSWFGPTVLPVEDRPFIAVDNTLKSRYRGRMYISGSGRIRRAAGVGDTSSENDLMVYRSLDGGITFQPPLVFSEEQDWVNLGWTSGVVLSDGTYVTGYLEFRPIGRDQELQQILRPTRPNARIKVLTFINGGETLSRGVTVSDTVVSRSGILTTLPSLAVDASVGPFRNRLYLAWNEYSHDGGTVLLAYSADGGKTWSKPTTVDEKDNIGESESEAQSVMATVAVNKEGVVGVMWYALKGSTELEYDVRFSASRDGGETFLPSTKISEASNLYDRDRLVLDAHAIGGGDRWHKAAEGNRMGHLLTIIISPSVWPGHTAGLVATADSSFHPFWIDNRTGTRQIWTSRIDVTGRAVMNGTKSLEGLEDVSEDVTFTFANAVLNGKKRTVTVDAYLENTSTDAIVGPVKIRILSLHSPLGTHSVQVINLDNTDDGNMVWDFSASLQGGTLGPGERSSPRRLEFQLSDVPTLDVRWLLDDVWKSRGRDSMGLINIRAKVLGHLKK